MNRRTSLMENTIGCFASETDCNDWTAFGTSGFIVVWTGSWTILLSWNTGSNCTLAMGWIGCGIYRNGIATEQITISNKVIRLSLKNASFRISKLKAKYNRLKMRVDFNRNNSQLFIFLGFIKSGCDFKSHPDSCYFGYCLRLSSWLNSYILIVDISAISEWALVNATLFLYILPLFLILLAKFRIQITCYLVCESEILILCP